MEEELGRAFNVEQALPTGSQIGGIHYSSRRTLCWWMTWQWWRNSASPVRSSAATRALGKILGDPDVAHDRGEPGDELSRLDPPNRLDRASIAGCRHAPSAGALCAVLGLLGGCFFV